MKSVTLLPSSPNITPAHLSKLLNSAKKPSHAAQIHAQLIARNHISNSFLFNALLNLYSKCGLVFQSLALFSASNSRTLFEDTKNVFTYTSLIAHLSRSNLHSKALEFFNEMRGRNIWPNHFTFSAVLPACWDASVGAQMHSLILKHGFESDVFVGSALVDMYAKSGDMGCAGEVFDEMPDRNLVSWNSVIVGSLRNGCYRVAISFFKSLIAWDSDSTSPDQVTFSSVLSACANIPAVAMGRQVHGVVIKHGLEYLPYVKNSLMDMYCKVGIFLDAKKLFSTTRDKDVVAWNVMVMGSVQNGRFEDAFDYFCVMRREGILSDEASFSTVLNAVAGIGLLDQGTSIHSQVIKSGFGKNTCIASSLIKMYSKCGSLVDARRVFAETESHNVVSWTAMLSAFQQHGCADQAIELFEEMVGDGVEPDYITFVSVLSACGHTGRVEDGFSYFDLMSRKYKMDPGVEHYACMVDLLGRVGRLNDAKRFVEEMKIEPDALVWGALLGACRKHGDLDFGKQVAERLFEIEPENPGNYVLLHNMYAVRGRLEEATEVRRLMGFNRVKKEPGFSWVDFRNMTHVFKAGDRSHPMTSEIYEMLGKVEELVKEKGYVAELQYAVNDVGEYKERSLWYHSEKLALAYGLLTLPVEAPIRIKKNLRTCGDCHVVMKFVSAVFKREIILRDINRFHRFVEGECSCGDYW